MSVYSFRAGPTYRGATPQETLTAALEMPMSRTATFFDQAKGGVLESFGLGTAIRDFSIPEGQEEEDDGFGIKDAMGLVSSHPLIRTYELAKRGVQSFVNDEESPALSEDAYKSSAWFREGVPWDQAMTEQRASALAESFDAKKVREFYAEKRPITAFIGNLAGQAADPINYVPVAGPAVKAAAVARLGKVAGASVAASLDAAANTAIFGIGTAQMRQRYGDDVSWQTTVSEIATAALIGAGFGAIGGALGRRGDAVSRSAIEERLATLKTTQEARIALNEGIDALVRGEDVRLSPNATEPVRRVVRSLSRVDDDAPTVVTPTGLRINVQPEIIDASLLVKAGGDLQPRDRTRLGSDAQIAEIAAKLDPSRLMMAPEADRGAPVVGPDNVVESGNGRVAAIRRAAEAHPERFEAYKQALRDAGYNVPDEGIPVLVARRTSDLTHEQRVQFVNDSNTSAIARMSATEIAAMDIRAMTGALQNYVPGEINSAGNRAFVGSFLRDLPPNERASLIDAEGRLNADGARRIENALIAAAYGDADIIARFAEIPDPNVKSIMGAMSDAAGDWAGMRREIAEGQIDPQFDITANLTDALRLVGRVRENAASQKRPVATVMKETLGQIDLLAGDIDPRTKAFVQSFYKNDQFTQANGRDIIAEHLGNIVRAARELGKPQLFGDATAVSPSEMISNASPQTRQADIFGAGNPRESGGADGQGGQDGQVRGAGEADAVGAEGLDAYLASPEIQDAIARMDAIPRTDLQDGYGSPEWFEGRVYNFDGEQVRGLEPTVDRLVERARNLAAKETGQAYTVAKQRKAVIVIGPPASGKSTIANRIAVRSRAAIADVDDAKQVIPEYQGGIGANAVHEESADLGRLVFDRLIEAGDNLIVPKVGHAAKGIDHLREKLQANGYSVELVLMDVPPEIAMQRMIGRFKNTGRLINPAYFKEVAPLPKQTYAELISQGKFNGFAAVESREGVPARVAETSGRESSLAPGEELVPVAAGRPERGIAAPRLNEGRRNLRGQGIDLSHAKPEPLPEGLVEAEARVGRPDEIRQLSEQYGVDLTTGDFVEMADIDQMRVLGRLTNDDEAALVAASEDFEAAEAYGNTLKAAAFCLA